MNTQESDRKAYAQEQLDLARSFYQKGDVKKAREYSYKVIREDDPSAYAWLQYNLGFSFYTEGNIESAREHWCKVIREDDPSAYAWSQYALGSLFDKEGKIEKAREYWYKVTQEDDPSAYAWSQYDLGYLFNKEGKIEKAREYWYKVTREDDLIVYAWLQYFLGLSFNQEGNIETAREHWYEVIREENLRAYVWSQYFLGLSFNQDGNIEKSQEHWNNFRGYQELFKDNSYRSDLDIYNTQKIITCLYNNNRQEVSGDLLKLTDFFKNIQQHVMDIQEYLHINPENLKNSENYFSHYTRVDIAEKIIKNGSFHLGIANYMNDPTEGKILFKEWNIPLDYNDNLMAFLTSFTFNENSLNQFRLYGKQDGKDGSGLSLVVNSQFFNSILDFDKNLNSNMELLTGNVAENLSELTIKKKTIPEKLQLFRCIYMNPETDYISAAHRSKLSFYLDSTLEYPEKAWQDYLEKMNKITDEVKNLLSKIKDNIDDIQQSIQELKISKPDEIYKALSTTLLPIIYLTKHAAFEEEAECRVLYVTSVLDDEIQWEDDRVYVEYKTKLADQYLQDEQSQNYLERIYLGPKADPRAELNLKKCWIDKMRDKKMANNEIKIPTIIKSDMPLA